MWNSISVILICFSLTANDIEHLFVWLLVICISSLEKCIFIFFALFKVGLFVLLLLNCYLIHFYGFIYIFILKILKIYVLSLDFLSSLDPPQMQYDLQICSSFWALISLKVLTIHSETWVLFFSSPFPSKSK